MNRNIANIPVTCTDDSITSLKDCQGQWLVLYIYPKDNTPGCTKESIDFNSLLENFESLNARIVGVSRDSMASHHRFIEKKGLLFPLISDESSQLCDYLNVIRSKSMYGKTFLGIERSTFLIDPKGMLRAEWRKVRVKEHAERVLETLTQLGSS